MAKSKINHKIAIGTISMGWHPSHTLEKKLRAAKEAGFQGVELFDDDLNKFAHSHGKTRLEAATEIGNLFKAANIAILCYSSFDNFEGEAASLDDRLNKAREWIAIAQQLNTNVIQIPSNDHKDAIGDEAIIIKELQTVADLGSQQDPIISFAYEALAWGTYVADWEESLRIVQLVNRPNFGLCLDTYHVISRIWADPRSPSGIRPGGAAALRDTVQRFIDLCPPEKIIYIQLSDAEKLDPPILPGHPAYHEDKDGTHSWCMFGRMFPLDTENGAYFPMERILRAWLLESKWSGWVSMEVFHRDMAQESLDPAFWAKRGRISWNKVLKLLE